VSELLTALRLAGIVLAVWIVVAVAAVLPVALLFRRRALANERRTGGLGPVAPHAPADAAAVAAEGSQPGGARVARR